MEIPQLHPITAARRSDSRLRIISNPGKTNRSTATSTKNSLIRVANRPVSQAMSNFLHTRSNKLRALRIRLRSFLHNLFQSAAKKDVTVCRPKSEIVHSSRLHRASDPAQRPAYCHATGDGGRSGIPSREAITQSTYRARYRYAKMLLERLK